MYRYNYRPMQYLEAFPRHIESSPEGSGEITSHFFNMASNIVVDAFLEQRAGESREGLAQSSSTVRSQTIKSGSFLSPEQKRPTVSEGNTLHLLNC